jgi:CubicO group peptidase (beta-lactamase class C family)
MSDLKVEVDPAEAGLDAACLARIDRYFARYVDDGRLPGWLAVVSRGGRVVHLSAGGHRDVEAGLPVTTDTQWRIFCLTKPVIAVAAMTLYEEGAFALTDPVERFIPAFADPRVYVDGSPAGPITVPAREPVRIWHLLTHTGGLAHSVTGKHMVDLMFRDIAPGWDLESSDLAERCDRWATLPLLFHPGERWSYSASMDVLGRIIEVVSGMSLDEFLRQRVFGPLGMDSTTFGPADPGRIARLYRRSENQVVADDTRGVMGLSEPRFLSGGNGLVSTAADYHRFTSVLLNHGEYDGGRLLSRRTIEYMTANHLPGGADMGSYGLRPPFPWGPSAAGLGFGLGFSVTIDPAATRVPGSVGDYGWMGAGGTVFWVDPSENLTVALYAQLIFCLAYGIWEHLRQLVYHALVD